MQPKRLVVAISGASAPIYGIRALQLLKTQGGVETHLVLTRAAAQVLKIETDWSLQEARDMADVSYRWDDMAAPISSGSFPVDGMLVAPCSINTLSCIAASMTKDLVVRAADVTLKERRRLVLMVRESPLHLGHLRRMAEAAEAGAVIAPPIPAFYTHPQSVAELVDQSVGRALDLLGIHLDSQKRWGIADGADSP